MAPRSSERGEGRAICGWVWAELSKTSTDYDSPNFRVNLTASGIFVSLFFAGKIVFLTIPSTIERDNVNLIPYLREEGDVCFGCLNYLCHFNSPCLPAVPRRRVRWFLFSTLPSLYMIIES